MDHQRFIKWIRELPFGKRLSSAVYVYAESLASDGCELHDFVEQIRGRLAIKPEFNLIKFYLSEFKLSFLSYPDFLHEPHPELKESLTVDLASGKVRRHDYSSSHNPPILHRKETMLEPDHPMKGTFLLLTEAEEAEGLYEDSRTIGFKRNWESLLTERGFCYSGHELVRREGAVERFSRIEASPIPVHRHKTAIIRTRLSRPVQTLVEYGMLSDETTFLDYGCGQGDDVERLRQRGHSASAWDPMYFPDGPKQPADIVNLGFVLNVIENTTERVEVLRDAFELTLRLLVVSTLVATSSTAGTGRAYKDGILTNRNTFQKYFRQDELRQYIEDVLEIPPVAVGLGIFYVFRSLEEQQAFLASRNRHAIDWLKISKRLRPPKPDLYELHQDILDAFWTRMLDLGRLPLLNEFKRHNELCDAVGSAAKARALFIRRFGEDTIQKVFELRRNDLLVYVALSSFKKPVPLKYLPESLKADVKTFLGGYKKGLEEAVSLLFAVGNPKIITRLCEETSFGYLTEQALFIHRSLLPDLHPILRIYVGCAELLAGDLREIDLIKLHKRSGKVSLLRYDDFDAKPLPELIERIKVNLKQQSVEIFDHRSGERQELLYYKERYVAPEHPDRESWESFSVKLQELGLDLDAGFGPTKQELLAFLNASLTTEYFRSNDGTRIPL
jgi:DNA phosphorothioation-associated putative methyltransferase